MAFNLPGTWVNRDPIKKLFIIILAQALALVHSFLFRQYSFPLSQLQKGFPVEIFQQKVDQVDFIYCRLYGIFGRG